ncbi:MAG: hypothetical protein MR766_05735 [Erysipelotrichaceae bacterium]|nr:hypothetical protein [Erysipelotrichaceae bacterium]
MKSNYDKKQNILMILLFIGSISLTAGITAKLTKKANDNANKINQVNDDLTKLENLVKQDKAKLLFEAIPGESDNDTSASIDLPLSIIDDYSMIFVETRVDEFTIQEYYLTKVLSKTESLNYYMVNGDKCGADQNTLAGAIIFFTPDVDNSTLNLKINEVYFDTVNYQYVNGHFCEFKEDGGLQAYDPGNSGIAFFSNIYGIK